MTPKPRRALLDTSVLIDFPGDQIATIADELAVAAVSVGELLYGVSAAADPIVEMQRRRRVQAVLDRFEVLAFDSKAAEYYGALATLVREQGRNPRPRRLDLQIAAIAASHGLLLITRDGEDFAGLESALAVVELPPAK